MSNEIEEVLSADILPLPGSCGRFRLDATEFSGAVSYCVDVGDKEVAAVAILSELLLIFRSGEFKTPLDSVPSSE